MNKKIGMLASLVNLAAVAGFALSMLAGTLFLSYLSSIFIALSLVAMLCAFAYFSNENGRVAGLCGMAFGTMYALCNAIVYYTQITTVRADQLTEQAAALLEFGKYGLMFNYDMLGYCLMAVATFFAGLTIKAETKADRWLKRLLQVHGVFAIICFLAPFLGVFGSAMDGVEWMGTAALECWCLFFIPIGILSFMYCKKQEEAPL